MIQNRLITYQDQGKELEGFMAYDDANHFKRPGVILCHAWRGRDHLVCEKAMEVAKWGYTTFALDVFGKGVLGNSKEENQALIKPFLEDRNLLRRRLLAALDTFQQQQTVERDNIAVMGFCFGGLCALDLARSGADLKGAVSVHGLLIAPKNVKAETMHAKVLALHGNDDPLVPPEQVAAFESEMTSAKADWQIHIYGGTKHAFTDPAANDPNFGTVYNPLAAKRTWQSIRNFFGECLE